MDDTPGCLRNDRVVRQKPTSLDPPVLTDTEREDALDQKITQLGLAKDTRLTLLCANESPRKNWDSRLTLLRV